MYAIHRLEEGEQPNNFNFIAWRTTEILAYTWAKYLAGLYQERNGGELREEHPNIIVGQVKFVVFPV